MATYLTLCNRVLNDLNEVSLTSSDFASARGIQTSVKNFVNRSLHDIYNSLEEVPSLHKETYIVTKGGQRVYDLPSTDSPQTGDIAWRKIDWDTFRLTPNEIITNPEFTSNISNWTTVSGSPSYVSTGNGRLQLNASEVTQSVSTVKNKDYNLSVRLLDPSASGSSVTVKVGTTSGGTEILSETITVTDTGNGKYLHKTFTATASTTYIGIANASSDNLDIDFVRVSENTEVKYLRYLTYEDWFNRYSTIDLQNNTDQFASPIYVYKTQSGQLGVSPVPDSDNYRITFEYWKLHTELSAYDDAPDLEDRYSDLVVARARYYTYNLRSDPEHAMIANREYEDGLKRLRSDLINKEEYMTDKRVNLRYSDM